MSQLSFIDQCRRDEYIQPRDTHVIEATEVERLSGQNAKLLARLRQGPIGLPELRKMFAKHTSRISDVRAAGYDVRCVEHNRKTGFTRYALFGRLDGR